MSKRKQVQQQAMEQFGLRRDTAVEYAMERVYNGLSHEDALCEVFNRADRSNMDDKLFSLVWSILVEEVK
jgi:hypothetical protein